MQITRRTILMSAAAFGLVGTRVWSATEADFGDFSIQTLSDGHLELPNPDDADGATVESPLNVTLLRQGDELVLFDCGSGNDFVPTAGKLPEALAAAGIEPEDVTQVIFTHGHPDHFWGVIDEFDEPVFPNARMVMGRVERDFWTDPATLDVLPEDRQNFYPGASRRIETLGDTLELIEDGTEVLPGVTARLTPGHTRGHLAFDVAGKVLILGDAITQTSSFADPAAHVVADHFPEEAAETRAALLKELAASGQAITAYHLPDGGIGRVETDADSYRFVPEVAI